MGCCDNKNTEKDANKVCCGMEETETCTTTRKYGSAICDMPAGTSMYIGGRYMIKFHDPIAWSADVPYEGLEAVQHEGFTYISKKAVPVGIPLDNDEFWLIWADPNAQMEELRQTVENYQSSQNEINEAQAEFNEAQAEFNEKADHNIKNTGNKYFFDFEDYLTIEMPELATRSTQGATIDDEGYMYVFSDKLTGQTTPALLWKISLASPENRRYISFEDYPNIGHGNSIAFDTINKNIVIMSSNGYLTVVSKDLDVVSHVYTGSDDVAGRYSQIMLNDNVGVFAVSGTPIYRFFKRLSNSVLVLMGELAIEQGRGLTANLQDATMHDNTCYAMSSVDGRNTVINVFTSCGNVHGEYVVNDSEREYEGIFAYNGYLYITSNSRSEFFVKRAPLSVFPTISTRAKDTLSPNMKIMIVRRVISTDYYKPEELSAFVNYKSVQIGDFTFGMAEKIPHAEWDINNAYYYLTNEYFFDGSTPKLAVSRTGSNNIRCQNIRYDYSNEISFYYAISNANMQYLSRITIANENGSRNVNFSLNDSDFDTKVQSLFDTAQTVHLPALTANISMYPMGLNVPNLRAKCFMVLDQTV